MTQVRTAWMLAPAVLPVALLFAGGLALAAAEVSWAHLAALAHDREFWIALGFTAWVAGAATALSAVAGLLLALGLRRSAWVLQISVATPHLTMAVVLIQLAAPSGWIARILHIAPASFPVVLGDAWGAGIILGYVLKETPFIALMCAAVLARVGPEYEMAAQTLGAGRWQRLRYVTLPLVAPALVSSSLLVLAFVFGAFEMPYLLGRPYPAMLGVLAERRFASIDLADRPAAMAVALAMAAITASAAWLYVRLTRLLVGTEEPVIFG